MELETRPDIRARKKGDPEAIAERIARLEGAVGELAAAFFGTEYGGEQTRLRLQLCAPNAARLAEQHQAAVERHRREVLETRRREVSR